MGHVIVDVTEENIPFASIYIEETGDGTMSNEDGQFEFRNLPAGKYNLRVSAVGYTTVTKEVLVSKEFTSVVHFKLKVEDVMMDELVVSANRNMISRKDAPVVDGVASAGFNYEEPIRRKTCRFGIIGGENVPVVVGGEVDSKDVTPDIVADLVPVVALENAKDSRFIAVTYADLTPENIAKIKLLKDIALVASSEHVNAVGELRALVHRLVIEGVEAPVIIRRQYNEASIESLRIKASADLGVLLIDGLVDGLWIENPGISATDLNSLAFGILQATRARMSKTEYIACPGCGRTLYDLQGTLARIKAATAHLKGLKIGVMGCIVNGPGEMADADYGYVGAARGKVSLYRRKECVEKNVPEEEAIERLLQLIENDSKN